MHVWSVDMHRKINKQDGLVGKALLENLGVQERRKTKKKRAHTASAQQQISWKLSANGVYVKHFLQSM